MEIRNITTFIRAAELQSFSQAATQLGYSQSAVTVQIRQLEKELGVPLFERIGKKVRLTEQGMKFWEYSLDILKAIDAVKTNLGGPEQIRGSLRVGTAESLLISVLPSVILDYHSRNSNVELITRTGIITELFDMIRHNDVDLLFFLDKKVSFPEWVKVYEKKEPIVFVASSKHPLAKEQAIPAKTLVAQSLLLTEKSISYRYDLEQTLATMNLELHPCLETGNTEVITNLLLQNAGVSFLPEYVVKPYVESGDLTILDVDLPEIEMWTQLVYHKNKWVTPQMKMFIECLKSAL